MDSLLLVVKGVIIGAIVLGVAYFAFKLLSARIVEPVGRSYRVQLLNLGIALATIIVLLVVLPFDQTLRGQLLSLTGILLSAVIALSSTTFVGNVMAGAMLRSIKNCTIGDYVHIGEYFGRISEMDLLHVEVQTEDRDLVTLPNLYTVTNPMKVLRASGTIVSASLSLGYDVDRKTIEKILLEAAEISGLEQPFVHIKELGDFSVTYKINGLLNDLSILLSTRSKLRGKVIDLLHDADIEIVSPTFMNQRQYQTEQTFMPAKVYGHQEELEDKVSDSVVFDKATQAEKLKGVKDSHAEVLEKIKGLEALMKEAADEPAKQEIQGRIDELTAKGTGLEDAIVKHEGILDEES